jgi:YfiH family protein
MSDRDLGVIEVSLPGATAAFSSRRGGVSEGPYRSLNLGILTDDRQERIARNRAILAERLGLEPAGIAMGWQVHGSDLKEWSGPPERDRFGGDGDSSGDALDRVDAHATVADDLALLVLVADCLPIALSDGDRIAMLHCGWRGLAGGIVERALETFEQPPAAALGPRIGPCCYEVGDEVLARFGDVPRAIHGGTLDLGEVARSRLAAAGVSRVEDVDLCTSCRPDLFFSHRRDGGVTGRQAGLVWRS